MPEDQGCYLFGLHPVPVQTWKTLRIKQDRLMSPSVPVCINLQLRPSKFFCTGIPSSGTPSTVCTAFGRMCLTADVSGVQAWPARACLACDRNASTSLPSQVQNHWSLFGSVNPSSTLQQQPLMLSIATRTLVAGLPAEGAIRPPCLTNHGSRLYLRFMSACGCHARAYT